jgi:hypothetical protein
MNELILDIKVKIATLLADLPYPNDVLIWNLFLLYDEEFKKYAFTCEGRNIYINNFTKISPVIIQDNHGIIHKSGKKLFGKLNSINDQPAIEDKKWSVWCKNGLVHRDGKPAYGKFGWYQNGKLCREDSSSDAITSRAFQRGLPAFDTKNLKKWYRNGKLHSFNGRPAVEFIRNEKNKELSYWIDGKFIGVDYIKDGKITFSTEYGFSIFLTHHDSSILVG